MRRFDGLRLRSRSGKYERSSIGRAPVSKTGGWGFDSLRSCCPRRRLGGRYAAIGPSERDARPSAGAESTDRARSHRESAELVLVQQERQVPWAKSKTKCRRRNRRSPARGSPAALRRGLFALFLVNLTRADLYKPMQGWYARVYTGARAGSDRGRRGLAGSTRRRIEYPPLWRFGLPARLRRRPGLARSSGSFISRRSPSS